MKYDEGKKRVIRTTSNQKGRHPRIHIKGCTTRLNQLKDNDCGDGEAEAKNNSKRARSGGVAGGAPAA